MKLTVPFRELSMPPLSSLNLSRNHTPAHSPAATAYQPGQHSYFAAELPAQPAGGLPSPQRQQPAARHAVQSPAEATIQSWAGGEAVQQPQPVGPPANPMGGIWNPAMGIKFGGGGGPGPDGQGQGQGQGGTWNPNGGIKFG